MTNADVLQPRGYIQDQREHGQDRRDDQQESAKQIARLDERLNGHDKEFTVINTSVLRLEDKAEKHASKLEVKIDKLQWWLMSSIFTVLMAILAGVLTLKK